MSTDRKNEVRGNFGLAWLLLCLAFGLHIWDEAAHDFLRYYNATALTIWAHFSWLPRMDMEFRPWLFGVSGVTIVFLLLTPFAYRNARWIRALGYLFAGAGLAGGLGHILATILGHTVPSVAFDGPAPGFYTAPLLVVFSLFLFWSLKKSRV
jgi:hypothetical protein